MNQPRLHDATAIRASLAEVIKQSKKSHVQIAEEMSLLLGQDISESRLYKYTAASRDDYRWPAEYDIAFCQVVGDYTLLADRVIRAGFLMIGPEEQQVLKLGRAYLLHKRAAQDMATYEKTLQGVNLG